MIGKDHPSQLRSCPNQLLKNLASFSKSINSTISVCLYDLAIVVYLDYLLGRVRRGVQDCVEVFVGQYLHDLAILVFGVSDREEIYLCSYELLIKTYNVSPLSLAKTTLNTIILLLIDQNMINLYS